MKKFIAIIISAFLLFSMNGCGKPSDSKDIENGTDDITETLDDTDSKEKNESKDTDKEKPSKRKYDDISSESEPVGVEVSLKNESDYTYVTGRIYKNSDSPETGYITVTFELYDEEDNYICKKVISTEELLEYGEDERFSENIIWEADDKYKKGVSDELLEQYTVKIVDIEEISGDEAELNLVKNEIEYAIEWYGDYEKAQILLDDALGKYPDDVDLKLLQRELNEKISEE